MITIKIKTDNAEFSEDARGFEVSRILRELGARYEHKDNQDGLVLFDYNGNRVGEVKDTDAH